MWIELRVPGFTGRGMRGIRLTSYYCPAAHSVIASASSSTLLQSQFSLSLAEYHSARVCAPPPSPPAPMDRAGTPSESGILASVEPRRRSVRRPRWRSTARKASSSGESAGSCAAGRSPIFSMVKASRPRLRGAAGGFGRRVAVRRRRPRRRDAGQPPGGEAARGWWSGNRRRPGRFPGWS